MKITQSLVLFCAAAALVHAMPCPGSSAAVHASCQVSSTVASSCSDAMAEVTARVNGQYGKWHDPHNNGTYTIDSTNGNTINAHRKTGDGKYTDKMTFTFSDSSDGGCGVQACSESQVTSVGDFSTNYCNTRMLLCGAADGCKPVNGDAAYSEGSVKPSFGASHDASACLKV